MADGQLILDTMEDIYPEIDVQPGDADVTRALRCANRAQDLLELEMAKIPLNRSGQGTHEDVTTTANQEYTTAPTGYLTVERVQFVDPGTSRPAGNLDPVPWVGDISIASTGLDALALQRIASTGTPTAYSYYQKRLYWKPVPDAVHTMRVYGFKVADDIAVGTAFAYGDELIWPVAAVAARIYKMRVDDNPAAIMQFAAETFGTVLGQLKMRWKDGPSHFRHTEIHEV